MKQEIGKHTENTYEKNVVIQRLTAQDPKHYRECRGTNIQRKTDEVIIEEDLREFLGSRYSDLTETEIGTIIRKLKNVPFVPLYNGNREAFWLVTRGFDLIREDKSKPNLHIQYIDPDNAENNNYRVVSQYAVKGPRQVIRVPDVLIFVNGIPVVIWELKSLIEKGKTIKNSWGQICDYYAKDIPNLLRYCFLAVISDGSNTRLGSVFSAYDDYRPWNEYGPLVGLKSLDAMIEGVFVKERLLAILSDFIFYPDSTDTQDYTEDTEQKKTKVRICRHQQFVGANKMFDSIRKSILSRSTSMGRGGSYSGAPGCGKTMTMLFLSRLILHRDNKTFRNPTIIIIVDREDLNTQASQDFIHATSFLGESKNKVMSLESLDDINPKKKVVPETGGVYITTIQKFHKDTEVFSTRSNIICISDEAHRTQTNVAPTMTEGGTTYGLAEYLRRCFPNATYCGFSGTVTPEARDAFGDIVAKYTMRNSFEDGTTVKIVYESRLVKAHLHKDKLGKVDKYYKQLTEDGVAEEHVRTSEQEMSRRQIITSHPDRIKKVAEDIVNHYESGMEDLPVALKAMVVCSDRRTALDLLKAILKIRPGWGEKRKAENEDSLSKDERDKLIAIPKINLVATQGDKKTDGEELTDMCGDREYRTMLAQQFKDPASNFKLAVVVDMWTTGFDVPCLGVMYIDKPLQKHTLIQTISRVNRVFEGKSRGLIVDYYGIERERDEAFKLYGGEENPPLEDMDGMVGVFRDYLWKLEAFFKGFDSSEYFHGNIDEQYECVAKVGEFVLRAAIEKRRFFMSQSGKLDEAYSICCRSGKLSAEDVKKRNFYAEIRSYIYKIQPKPGIPDAKGMNSSVRPIVRGALAYSGVEGVMDGQVDLLSEDFLNRLKKVKRPLTRVEAFLARMRTTFSGGKNKVKAVEFSKRLELIVEKYNNREGKPLSDKDVDDISNDAEKLLEDYKKDRQESEKLGLPPNIENMYTILTSVRDEHGNKYPDEKCKILASEVRELVDDKWEFPDWTTKRSIKSRLRVELMTLLHNSGYPISRDEDQEVFEKIMEQEESELEFDKDFESNVVEYDSKKDSTVSISPQTVEPQLEAAEDETEHYGPDDPDKKE